MIYLRVANPGVAPVESFTLLGASTTRHAGIRGTSGTFGSGAKHFVRLCLTNGLQPIVYCGNLRLEFYARPTTIDDGLTQTEFGVICCRLTGQDEDGKSYGRTIETSMTTEFGQADWTALEMGLREIVTNALDRAHRERVAAGADADDLDYIRDVEIEVCDKKPRAKAGTTQVFIEYTDEVQKFHRTLGQRFLHFSEPENLHRRILPKKDRDLSGREVAVIYRDGYRVREIRASRLPSVFDYNFTSRELPIDESRNLDDYTVAHKVGWALLGADPADLARVLERTVVGAAPCWEAREISAWSLTLLDGEKPEVAAQIRANWKRAWEAVHGEAIACTSPLTAEMVAKKGKVAKQVTAGAWAQAIAQIAAIPTDVQVLTKSEQQGRELVEADPSIAQAHATVWDVLAEFGLTNGREIPPVKAFTGPMDAECETKGFYEDGMCAIQDNLKGSSRSPALVQTVLEELAHHTTGSGDNSRDFQDYAFKVATYAILALLAARETTSPMAVVPPEEPFVAPEGLLPPYEEIVAANTRANGDDEFAWF